MKKTIAALVAVTAAAGLAMAAADQGRGQGLRRPPRPSRPGPAQLLEKYDANKNGVLDPEEKEAAKAEWQAHRKEREAQMLERFDANKNGVLDPEEKEAARKEFKAKPGRGARSARAGRCWRSSTPTRNGTASTTSEREARRPSARRAAPRC